MRPQNDYVYFAFLDILGYKESLDQDIMHTSLVFKDRLIEASAAFNNINVAHYHHREISDSIFIHSSSVDIVDFLHTIRQIYNHYLSCNLLLRGGISYGRHFESNSITYSLALTEAYRLENQQAIYPRILIHNSIIDIANTLSENGDPQHINSIIASNLICQDGSLYVLNTIDDASWRDTYQTVKNLYEGNKDKIDANGSLRQKYIWLHDYIISRKPSKSKLKPFIEKMTPLS
ncbi:hypothetical protein [Chromobacterium violaceum]|uniref:hypothetical protein n=1 Tax=Chromobacterium violaceum TaxID=536 RepID=UPI000B2FC5F0|nr:hypothetical protein [Chromobacterium violaceum]